MALKHYSVRYDPADLRRWINGNYNLLKQSRASEFIRQILIGKATRRRRARLAQGKRGDRRFFGEAFVAAHPAFSHEEGWYGSFKWLSARAWCSDTASLASDFHERFRSGLDDHLVNLKAVQSKETVLRSLLDGKHAVSPDLWLFTGREHRFIEVKLPRDHLRDSQLAGLALIDTCLRARCPVSVEVVSLVPDVSHAGGLSMHEQNRFASFCRALNARHSATLRPDKWRWREGFVDRSREHIEIRVGDASSAQYHQWVPAALVGRPVSRVFPVQWLTDAHEETAIEVRRELNFYLVEHPADYSQTGAPWDYLVYHCGTGANVYSKVHWSYFPDGHEGERHASAVITLSASDSAKLFGNE